MAEKILTSDQKSIFDALPGQPVEVRRKFLNIEAFTKRVAETARQGEFILHCANICIKMSWTFAGESDTLACPNSRAQKCNLKDRYRTMDGTCNNLQWPEWGSYSQWLQRFLKPDYTDGIQHSILKMHLCKYICHVAGKWLPRGSDFHPNEGYRSRLPSPRLISASIFVGNNVSDDLHTHMLMQFGQFLDHDLTATSKDGTWIQEL